MPRPTAVNQSYGQRIDWSRCGNQSSAAVMTRDPTSEGQYSADRSQASSSMKDKHTEYFSLFFVFFFIPMSWGNSGHSIA